MSTYDFTEKKSVFDILNGKRTIERDYTGAKS